MQPAPAWKLAGPQRLPRTPPAEPRPAAAARPPALSSSAATCGSLRRLRASPGAAAALALAAVPGWRQRRPRARGRSGRRAADASAADSVGTCLPRDGGVAAWRAGQEGPELELPVILFPISDLLLLGHTKRMHLFEPRWVDMVDTSRRQYGGVIGLVYFSPDGDVVDVATVAEVVACGNLGAAGRMVTVRGAGRARLLGLTASVATPDLWGLGNVEELPELLPEDLREGAAEAAARELERQLEDLDLSAPPPAGEGGGRAGAGGAGGEEGSGGGEGEEAAAEAGAPELWTHERAEIDEDFTCLAGGAWREQREAVEQTLAGVPRPELSPAAAGARGAVAALYAALGAAGLETRLRLFAGRGRSLSQRLGELSELVQERQGMARARRAVAGVFGG